MAECLHLPVERYAFGDLKSEILRRFPEKDMRQVGDSGKSEEPDECARDIRYVIPRQKGDDVCECVGRIESRQIRQPSQDRRNDEPKPVRLQQAPDVAHQHGHRICRCRSVRCVHELIVQKKQILSSLIRNESAL